MVDLVLGRGITSFLVHLSHNVIIG